MSKQETSVDELLDGIILGEYNRKRELLLAGAQVVLKNVGIRHDYYTVLNDDIGNTRLIRRNMSIERVVQSYPIVLLPEDVEVLGLETNAVAFGRSEEWYATSFVGSFLFRPHLTSYYVWPLIYGDNHIDKSYPANDADIFINDYRPDSTEECLSLSGFEGFINATARAGAIALPEGLKDDHR
ncbi:MAG TPA: hypothetical protein VFN31_02390 [Candidatus Saccharimonadales bacterium]|nr:hypothetical protein [Candidatus Saccharimonadales bacterium]